MEFINWKNILLEWANRLNFLGRPYYSLNLVEIESFYCEFQTNMTSVNIASKKLDSFIKSYYPEFLPEWNKEGKMCPDDYVFGYSLLMYFSCVTHPEEKMHKTCKSMQSETQMVIKTFLQNMLECNSFSREAIKTVIESSAPAKVSDYVLALSPNKVNEINTCPPTPRTKILNEWNSENRQLKALVETERYEKGFLELQLKKKDEQIDNLTQERRKFLADIHGLKSQLNEKDMENVPPNNYPQTDSLKRRLRQELTEKDVEIKDLRNQVDDLSTSKQHLAQKYSYVESLYSKSVICSTEMTVKLDELTETCEKQQQQIKGLEINIKEYQKYFNESNSKGNSLDTSLDNLDDSYAIAMANLPHRSMSSPENLGKVVDIQLREQILLYDRISEKCSQLEMENSQLNDRVKEHVKQLKSLEQTRVDLEAQFTHSQEREQKLFEEKNDLAMEIETIRKELSASDSTYRIEIDSLKSEISRLEIVKSENLQRVEELEKGIDAKDAIFKDKCSELTENKELLVALQKDNEKLNDELSKVIEECSQCRNDRDSLTQQIVTERQNVDSIQADYQRLMSGRDLLQDQLSAVEVKSVDLATRINILEQTRVELEAQLNQSEEEKEKLAMEIETIREELSQSSCQSIVEMDSLKSEISRLEIMKSENLQRIEELERGMDAIHTSLKDKCSELTENKELLVALQKDNEKLNAELSEVNTECSQCRNDRDSIQADYRQVMSERDLLQGQLSAVDEKRVDLETRINILEQTRVELEAQLNQSEEEKEKLREDKNDLAMEIETIREELSQTDSANVVEIDSLKSEARRLEIVKSENLQRIEELEKGIAAIHIESTENKELLVAMQKDNEKLNAELNKVNAECIEFRNDRDSIQADYRRVMSERDLLQGQLSAVDEKRVDLETRINILEQTRVELEAQLRQSQELKQKMFEEKSDLAMQIETTRKEISSSASNNIVEIDSLKSEISRLEIVKKENLQRIEGLVKSVDANDVSFKNKCSELTKYEGLLVTMQKDNEKLNVELCKVNAECSQCRTDRDSIQADYRQVISERDLLQGQLSAVEEKGVDLETRINILEQTRIELEAQLRQSQEIEQKLREEKNDLAMEIETIRKELSQSDSSNIVEMDSLKSDISRLEIMKSENLQRIEELERGMDAIHTSLKDKCSELTENKELLVALQKDNEKLNDELKRVDLDTRINILEETCVGLEAQLNQSEEEKEKLREEKNDLAMEIETIRKELSQTDSANVVEIDSLKSEARRLEIVKSENLQRIEELEKGIAAIHIESTENKELLVAMQKDNEKLNDELSECRNDRDSLTQRSVTDRQIVDSIQADYQRVISERDLLQGQLSGVEVKCVDLETRINILEQTRVELEAQLNQSEEEKEKLFLNLQVKIDEAEATELTLKGLSEQCKSEAAKCQSLSETNSSNCKAYEQNKIQLEAIIEELKQSIGKLNIQNENLSTAHSDLARSKTELESESYQRSADYKAEIETLLKDREIVNLRVKELTIETEKLGQDLEKARRENVSLTDENVDLATEIEKVRELDSANRLEIDSLKSELNHRIEELKKSIDVKPSHNGIEDKCSKLEADLKIALSDLEAKIQECHQGQEIYKQLVNDNKILSAKLTKHREASALQQADWQKERSALKEQRDKSCQEIRFELDGKLNKMKERMKHIYTEETCRSKEKHEKQERELVHYKNQCQLLSDKVDKYVNHVQTISEQLYKLNDQILDLKKENEFLKSKLRLAESNPREMRLFSAPNFLPNLKMEDEEGEVFNNTYLADLKSGISRTSPIGRESVRQSELHQRNSMAARHLRSTYAAQYGDQNLREEDISMPYLNDSMFSNQLDVRRGTLYQRPGPPTPSKNGGRLSFGGSTINASDLFPKDILREQNTNAKTKTTPGKLMSMFSSSKHKETDRRKSITRPIYSTFTSTPRQKSNWTRDRRSMLAVKPNSSELTDCDDDEAASISSNDSLSSKTSGKRKSITRQFSIISKCKQGSGLASIIHKNRQEYRREYRVKNHSQRQKGFEEGREMFLKMNDDGNRFQMVLHEQMGYLQPSELFPLDLRPSEKFEILTKHTTSEHPYSNEPTTVEAIEGIEANDSSLISRTMSNIIIYGKIPRIKVNETPQRELIRPKRRSDSVWFRLMDLTKQIVLVFIVIVVYASYIMWNFVIRKNE